MAIPWRRSARLDADAVDYFARIAAVGGGLQNGLYSEYGSRRRLSDFFTSLKDLGLWPSISELGIFLGVDSLSACLVKARFAPGTPAMLTSFNFVAGDYSPTGAAAGLRGDGSTKYLSTGVNQASLSRDAHSLWVYVTNAVNSAASEALIGGNASPGAQVTKATDNIVGARVATTNPVSFGVALSKGLVGYSRTSSSTCDWIVGANFGSQSGVPSEALASSTMSVMARGTAFPSKSTVAIYGLGGKVDLSALALACNSAFTAFGGTP